MTTFQYLVVSPPLYEWSRNQIKVLYLWVEYRKDRYALYDQFTWEVIIFKDDIRLSYNTPLRKVKLTKRQ